jgi:acyl-CoA thioester hydrolase
LGISYRQLEDSGILLPVSEYSIKFHKPAYYDDELLIITKVPVLPAVRIRFEYQTFRGDELLNTAQTDLVFVDKTSGKPMRCPDFVSGVFEPYY